MSAYDIILVIVSGLGVIHGLFLAIILWVYPKGNALANKLLSALLLALSFRVGKSVFLEFTDNLDVKIIFVGLSVIMVIGPLYYLFTRSAIDKSFNLRTSHLLHFIPALAGMIFGFQISDGQLESLPIALFAFLFIGYYLHLLIYLGISFRLALSHRTKGLKPEVFGLLKLMFYALLAIWVVYVLNILDEVIPYIVGPILYSIVAYAVSFIVFRKGYMEQIGSVKYKTTPISEEQAHQLFEKTVTLVDDQKLFLNPDLTLTELSGLLKVSPQIMSMVINQKSGMNFNGFINGYRITEALRLLELEQYRNHTISSIAFEVGFNSLSSFNTSFKKQTGSTPVAYRNSLMK